MSENTAKASTLSDQSVMKRLRRLVFDPNVSRDAARHHTVVDDGIEIVPGLKLTRQRELGSMTISGAQGSGKTQLLMRIARAAQRRHDHIIIVDNKGDLTERMPNDSAFGARNGEFERRVSVMPILLAPQDERSWVWDIAKDLPTLFDIEQFAEIMMPAPPNTDDFWVKTARAVLIACIEGLRARHKKDWTWEQLAQSVERPVEELRQDAQDHYRTALDFLDHEKAQKQVLSTVAQFRASLAVVRFLGLAWPDKLYKAGRRFSVFNFVRTGRMPTDTFREPSGRTVIVQRSGRFSTISDVWISAFFTFAGRFASGSDMPDSDQHPLWLLVDEMSALPRIPDIEDFPERGRSKGLRVVLAYQVGAKIVQRYGSDFYTNMEGLSGMRFIGLMNWSEEAKQTSERFGEVHTRRYRKVPSGSGGFKSDPDDTRAKVMEIGDLSSVLGAKKRGCVFLALNATKGPAELLVPYLPRNKERKMLVEAEWLRDEETEELAKISEVVLDLEKRQDAGKTFDYDAVLAKALADEAAADATEAASDATTPSEDSATERDRDRDQEAGPVQAIIGNGQAFEETDPWKRTPTVAQDLFDAVPTPRRSGNVMVDEPEAAAEKDRAAVECQTEGDAEKDRQARVVERQVSEERAEHEALEREDVAAQEVFPFDARDELSQDAVAQKDPLDR